jgi:protocatechuate 3,4-dioxygenase beta subunit
MPNEFDPIRRRLLAVSALAVTGLVFDDAAGQQLPATPQCKDGDEPTVRQTAGPFFKPSSPQRADLVEPNTKGRLVDLSGQVLTRSCRPVAGALLDLWHADEWGEYDNKAFRYRGHIFADGEGRYRFRTILPALYPGRTRHYHVKVQAPQQSVLTTQLYFPADEAANRRDGLFRRELLMRTADAGDGMSARFDFVVDVR